MITDKDLNRAFKSLVNQTAEIEKQKIKKPLPGITTKERLERVKAITGTEGVQQSPKA